MITSIVIKKLFFKKLKTLLLLLKYFKNFISIVHYFNNLQKSALMIFNEF